MKTYKIATLPHYYQPEIQGRDRVSFDGDYDTVAAARAEISAQEVLIYYTNNGESGRPTLLVVDSVVADYIESGRNEDASNYDWDNAGCGCGGCNACCAMMIAQDRDYIRKHAEQ